MADDDARTGRLRASGTLNRHPERVRADRFLDDDFFDPRDLLQVRYEMVRSTESATLAQVATAFGVSVPTCVRIKRQFREGGLQALLPLPRGPRQPFKINDDILAFIATYRAKHGPVGCRRLAPVIESRFGVRLHPRTITKALERLKKNPDADRRQFRRR